MRVRAGNERGQAFALMIVALVALLGTAAIVMDVGFAWYAKRQVQASADAAALAGAQELPDVDRGDESRDAVRVAEHARQPEQRQRLGHDPLLDERGGNWCGAGKTFQANTIAVTETATTPTWFANVLGFNHFDVKGVATACQPCSSAPVDIMLVVDRTGSMCSPTGPSGECTDLDNAKDGVQTLLGIMDPNIDTIGLVAFPPYNNNDVERGLQQPHREHHAHDQREIRQPEQLRPGQPGLPGRRARLRLQDLGDLAAEPVEQPRQAHAARLRKHAQLHPELRLDVVRRCAHGRTGRARQGRAPRRAEGHRLHDGRRGQPGRLLARRRGSRARARSRRSCDELQHVAGRLRIDDQPGRRTALPLGDQRRDRDQGGRHHGLHDRLRPVRLRPPATPTASTACGVRSTRAGPRRTPTTRTSGASRSVPR